MPTAAATAAIDVPSVASELRLVLGQLVRRLRAEHRFSLAQASVLGRLDREGAQQHERPRRAASACARSRWRRP